MTRKPSRKPFLFRVWLWFTVWMLRHDKFDYSQEIAGMTDAQLLCKIKSYKQGWPWVDANISYVCELLDKL